MQDAASRLEISGTPSYHRENKFHKYDVKIPSPQWRMFLELDKSCCSGLLFDPVVIVCSVSLGFTPREEDAKFRDFRRYFEVVLLEQVVVQKGFRRYPSY